MNYLVMLGSDMFYGSNGVLTVQIENKLVEFFRIREIYRARSEGSYLTVDCDIKDNDNVREVKLFKSKPVAENDKIIYSIDHKETIVKRQDGSLIIKIEQIELNNTPLLEFEPVKKTLSNFPPTMLEIIKLQLNSITIDAVIKITGDFYAGKHHLIIGNDYSMIGGIKIGGNLKMGKGGIKLTNNGFQM
jgi:hypothetical protein